MSGGNRPGAGFVILLATALAAAVFFGWGLRTPTLERVYELQIELGLGVRQPLSAPERELLSLALVKNPGIADGMLGDQKFGIISANQDGLIENGYAYLVAKKVLQRRAIELSTTDLPGGDPVPVEISTGAGHTRGELRWGAPFVWELPDDGPFPALVEVRFGARQPPGNKGGRDRQGIVVRMRELP